jgi:sterol desaturase/sphingolipid hydroxylase (fatty acid hydroxylase superfamily)
MNDAQLWVQVAEIARGIAQSVATIAVLFVPIWYLERRQGASASRYRSRHFAHDVAYAVFYRSGICAMLGAAYLASGAATHLDMFRWELLAGTPPLVAGLVYWVLNDLVLYWVHRAQHAIPWLWQFHSVHHATERLTFVTATRIHPIENLWQNTVQVLPLLILGLPPKLWVPIAIFQSFFDAVQHAELNWTYGPLYRVFVSPVFHRIHHSTERRHFDQNYAKVLSVWDHIFGTASPERVPPVAVGVAGMPSEPTLAGQFVGPFLRIAGSKSQTRDAASPDAGEGVRPAERSSTSAPASQDATAETA